jgi:phosphatidylglycerol lysyltransferase
VENWSLRVIALIIAGMGVMNMVSLFRTPLNSILRPLEQLSPFSINPSEPVPIALLGFLLIILADGLWRRKRAAWLIALLVLTASSISNLTDDVNYGKAAISITLGLAILSLTARFNVRSDQIYARKALRYLIISFSITMVYGIIGIYLSQVNYGNEFRLGESMQQSLVMFTQFYDPSILVIG